MCNTPILIDVANDGFRLTDAAGGVLFDLAAIGQPAQWSWTAAHSDDAWLVLDRNENFKIDDGAEMFGSATPQPEPPEGEIRNGFLALAVFDEPNNGGNQDGFIDSQDAIYARLRLWQDLDHNGFDEEGELHTLQELNVGRIDLFYKEKKAEDEYGNLFRYRGRVWDLLGKQNKWAWDVLLLKSE